MAAQPTSTAVGTMYDQFGTDLLTDAMGGYIHVGYWEDDDNHGKMEAATERLTREVGNRLSAGKRILDVGCGTGKSAVQIAAACNAQVTGINVSNYQLELARAQFEDSTKTGQVDFQFADAMDLPFPDASFDGAYAIESLVHMHDKSKALAHIARVLRPGARLVIADLLLDASCSDPPALARFHQLSQVPAMSSADDLQNLLQQVGLKVIEFTDIRENVRRTCEFLKKKAHSLDTEIGETLLTIADNMEQLKELRYTLIVAERLS